MSFGKNLRQRREELGYSIRQLSQKSGIAQSSICYYETERHSPPVIIAIELADALHTTVAELLKDGD